MSSLRLCIHRDKLSFNLDTSHSILNWLPATVKQTNNTSSSAAALLCNIPIRYLYIVIISESFILDGYIRQQRNDPSSSLFLITNRPVWTCSLSLNTSRIKVGILLSTILYRNNKAIYCL